MLHRIIGAAGSGKTEYIFDCLGKEIKKGNRCILIVPEQQSVAYEAALCDRFGDSVNMLCEVLNFERLPNRVARDFGGLAVNNIDKGGACALLSLIAEELKPQLSEYSAVASDADFAQSLFGLISRMKMALVTPQMLANTDNISDERLSKKLHDIALIYNEYEKHFGTDLFDPRDALTRLGAELSDKPFFKNTYVFIDSYYNFTEQEYAVIKEIIAQAKEVYVSFTTVENREFFSENRKACYRIGKLAKGIYDDFVTAEPKRNFQSLAFIEKHLWENNPPILPGDDGAVSFITAKNRFDEVEAAASRILSYVRSGGRFKDIILLAGNTDTYSSIIDSAFSRAGIPCYMSAKEDIATKPLFVFLTSSLSVIIEDFSLQSIKRYIKSGYTQLSRRETDALLNYATAWNLRGKAWYSDEDWTLDPEGYREGEITERGAKQLTVANRARNKVVMPLTALKESLNVKGLTVSHALRALYGHVTALNAGEQLRQNAELLLNRGMREESERDIQLWKHLINIFNQLESLCGNREVTPKRLLSLIRLMCSCYSLGAIPASADSVTFGSADLIRAGGSKMVIVLGACDGEFPSAVNMGSFFDRDEAISLEEAGLVLVDTMEKQLNTSRFFVYAALSAPSEKLVLLCPRAELAGGDLRPSAAWISVKKMLPNVTETEFSDKDMLYSAESVAANFPNLKDCDLKNKIEKALLDINIPFFRDMPNVTETESKIDYKENLLKLSPSRFETYIKCPFSYFGQYVLDLKQKKVNEFSMSEIGNFVHKILDQFLHRCVATGSFVCPDDNQRIKLIQELSKEYFFDHIGNEAAGDKQFLHIYSNMVKTIDFVAKNLCDEFTESKFLPSGFEFKIGLSETPDIPAIEYDVNGKRVLLRGSIDRVDTYNRNGVNYVRVIDYKTYNKTFSANLVEYGMDTQLLHYLFAYCEKTNSKPAGALYYTVILPNVKFTGKETDEQIRAMLVKELKRSGILLDDPEIVFAMNKDCRFVPVSVNKEGNLYTRSKSKVLYTEEEFQNLSKQLSSQVETLSENIFCGNMDIAPQDFDNKVDPCKYCSLGDFCRNKKQKEEEDESDNTTE